MTNDETLANRTMRLYNDRSRDRDESRLLRMKLSLEGRICFSFFFFLRGIFALAWQLRRRSRARSNLKRRNPIPVARVFNLTSQLSLNAEKILLARCERSVIDGSRFADSPKIAPIFVNLRVRQDASHRIAFSIDNAAWGTFLCRPS